MNKRIIPSSGEKLPVIGLGSWIQFDVERQEEKKELKEVLNLMHSYEAKMIDSSPMYDRSEKVIGELTSKDEMADKFFYATKVWTSGKEEGIEQMKASMKKMQRKVMDLIQIHNLVDWQTHLETLRKWKDEGLIRYYGITHYTTSSHSQLEEIIRKEPMDFVQFNYSIATRNAEKSLLPLAADKGVAVMINEPLEKGRLFENVANKSLPPWVSELGIKDWAGYFLKYIISHPAVTCVIPATSNPVHAKSNFEAGEGELADEKMRGKMVEYLRL